MRTKRKLVPILLFSATGACVDPTPPPDWEVSQALLSLRTDLRSTPKPDALSQMSHFRPICDADGYPLVGNVASKGPPEPGFQPSEFCAEVRK